MQRGMVKGLAVVAIIVLFAAPRPAAAQPYSNISRLADGVLDVIPPWSEESETYSGPLALTELITGRPELEWSPKYTPSSQTLAELAKRVVLRREIWCLEFAFKPMRTIYVDVPQPSGKMQRKLIWYMVYRVRYLGQDMMPKPEEDAYGHVLYPGTERIDYETRRFFPHFVLDSPELGEQYLDRVIPSAKQPIREREMRHENREQELYNTVEITRTQIPLTTEASPGGVWGVVTWEDIDPRMDYFSVLVTGLTNAFKLEEAPDAYQPGDPFGTGRTITFKSLQLNFWRPGDKLEVREEEIRFGVPVDSDPEMQREILDKYGIDRRLDYLWVYR